MADPRWRAPGPAPTALWTRGGRLVGPCAELPCDPCGPGDCCPPDTPAGCQEPDPRSPPTITRQSGCQEPEVQEVDGGCCERSALQAHSYRRLRDYTRPSGCALSVTREWEIAGHVIATSRSVRDDVIVSRLSRTRERRLGGCDLGPWQPYSTGLPEEPSCFSTSVPNIPRNPAFLTSWCAISGRRIRGVFYRGLRFYLHNYVAERFEDGQWVVDHDDYGIVFQTFYRADACIGTCGPEGPTLSPSLPPLPAQPDQPLETTGPPPGFVAGPRGLYVPDPRVLPVRRRPRTAEAGRPRRTSTKPAGGCGGCGNDGGL